MQLPGEALMTNHKTRNSIVKWLGLGSWMKNEKENR